MHRSVLIVIGRRQRQAGRERPAAQRARDSDQLRRTAAPEGSEDAAAAERDALDEDCATAEPSRAPRPAMAANARIVVA